MTGEEKLAEFLQAIEDWKSSKHLKEVRPPKDESKLNTILNGCSDWLKMLNDKECMMYAYELYVYAEYIETVKAKEKTVLEWADASIWFIIGGVINQYGSQYSKWQEKYYAAVKENPLASEILKIKNHAEARVRMLDGKHDRLMKMADTLNNLARRKYGQ